MCIFYFTFYDVRDQSNVLLSHVFTSLVDWFLDERKKSLYRSPRSVRRQNTWIPTVQRRFNRQVGLDAAEHAFRGAIFAWSGFDELVRHAVTEGLVDEAQDDDIGEALDYEGFGLCVCFFLTEARNGKERGVSRLGSGAFCLDQATVRSLGQEI